MDGYQKRIELGRQRTKVKRDCFFNSEYHKVSKQKRIWYRTRLEPSVDVFMDWWLLVNKVYKNSTRVSSINHWDAEWTCHGQGIKVENNISVERIRK